VGLLGKSRCGGSGGGELGWVGTEVPEGPPLFWKIGRRGFSPLWGGESSTKPPASFLHSSGGGMFFFVWRGVTFLFYGEKRHRPPGTSLERMPLTSHLKGEGDGYEYLKQIKKGKKRSIPLRIIKKKKENTIHQRYMSILQQRTEQLFYLYTTQQRDR